MRTTKQEINFKDLKLINDACICQTGGQVHYIANAKGAYGNTYLVRWNNSDLSVECADQACDWDYPDQIFNSYGDELKIETENETTPNKKHTAAIKEVMLHVKEQGLNYDQEDIRIVSGKEFDLLVKYWAISNFFMTDSGYYWVEVGENEKAEILILDSKSENTTKQQTKPGLTLLQLAAEIQGYLEDGLLGVVIWKEGRNWFYTTLIGYDGSTGKTVEKCEQVEIAEIKQKDNNAIIIDGYYFNFTAGYSITNICDTVKRLYYR